MLVLKTKEEIIKAHEEGKTLFVAKHKEGYVYDADLGGHYSEPKVIDFDKALHKFGMVVEGYYEGEYFHPYKIMIVEG